MRTLLPVLLAFLVLPSFATEVYRYVDDKGNVVFSDKPAKGAQKITVEPAPATSVVVPPMPVAPAVLDQQPVRPGAGPFVGYQEFLISQPSEGEPLLNTVGDVDVSLNLHPALRADLGHGITVLLDGQPAVEQSARLNITLNNVPRGEHVIEAWVLDNAGQVLMQAAPVRFSLQRPSLLMPGRQQPLSPIHPPLPQPRTTP